jgi:hypothetical protein
VFPFSLLALQEATPSGSEGSTDRDSIGAVSPVNASVVERDVRLLQQTGNAAARNQSALAEAVGPPIVALVRTPEELKSAIEVGTQHIVIKSHLDLTGLQPVTDVLGNRFTLGTLPATVESLIVRYPTHCVLA